MIIKWFKNKFKSNNQLNTCIKTIKKYGFEKSSLTHTYHKDFGTFDCEIWIRNDRIKLLVFAKKHDYYESETIGPPLPTKDELIRFINQNT